MRFRHLDPAPVLDALRASHAPILVREWERERATGGIAGMLRMGKAEAAAPARPASIEDVAFIASRRAAPDVAVVLRYFFHIESSSDERLLPLVEAVAHVEGRGGDGEFLLAGHPDGGLVSVSRQRQPFQHGDPITWWGP